MKGITLISAEWSDTSGKHFDIFRSMEDYKRATFRSDCKTIRLKKWSSKSGKWKAIGGSQMNAYHRNKERARELAAEWQSGSNDGNYSKEDIHKAQLYFTKLAVRYGLLEEFTENGII
jgi:hypothetical protein